MYQEPIYYLAEFDVCETSSLVFGEITARLFIAASNTKTGTLIDVIMAIGTVDPEVIVGDVPNEATVIGPTPAIPFASGGTAIFGPIAVGPATNGFKFIKVKSFAFIRPFILNLFIDALGIEAFMASEYLLSFFEAFGFA